MELSHTRGQSTAPSNRLAQLMRRYPLSFYFLIALGFSGAYDLTVMMFVHLPLFPWGGLLGFVFTLGPTLAAFLLPAVTQGRAGIRKLLRRYVLWRVGIPWYLFVLLGIPVLMLIAVLLLPGALAAFHLPGLSLLPTYLIGSLLFLVGGGSLALSQTLFL